MGRKADSPMFIAPASHNNKQASVNTAIHPSWPCCCQRFDQQHTNARHHL